MRVSSPSNNPKATQATTTGEHLKTLLTLAITMTMASLLPVTMKSWIPMNRELTSMVARKTKAMQKTKENKRRSSPRATILMQRNSKVK